MASIRLDHVTKVYDDTVLAVDDFTMDIDDKEFIVLVGPSGCGKSTVLRCIAGLEAVTKGQLYIADRLVNDVPPKDRDIAMVFQNYALYPHMTVYKNLAFGLENRKMPKKEIDTRVRAAAKLLGIEDLLKRKPRAMSGGQRQRVALGRALVREPAVFLLDEPLSNLDAKLRTSMRAEIIKLHKRLGATFVYVTHDQIEAMTMGDRIVVMDHGRVQQIDTPQNLYNQPANQFVAGFIGNPQMNFLDVLLGRDAQGWYLELPTAAVRLDWPDTVLQPYQGRQLVLGIRPDSVSIAPPGLVIARVEVVEALGGECHIDLDYQGYRLTVRQSGLCQARMDDELPLYFDLGQIHLFDKESGRTIANGRQFKEAEA